PSERVTPSPNRNDMGIGLLFSDMNQPDTSKPYSITKVPNINFPQARNWGKEDLIQAQMDGPELETCRRMAVPEELIKVKENCYFADSSGILKKKVVIKRLNLHRDLLVLPK
ncbi:hypothetical protein OTU49_002107, partial [Cherax quadricarinatus]